MNDWDTYLQAINQLNQQTQLRPSPTAGSGPNDDAPQSVPMDDWSILLNAQG